MCFYPVRWRIMDGSCLLQEFFFHIATIAWKNWSTMKLIHMQKGKSRNGLKQNNAFQDLELKDGYFLLDPIGHLLSQGPGFESWAGCWEKLLILNISLSHLVWEVGIPSIIHEAFGRKSGNLITARIELGMPGYSLIIPYFKTEMDTIVDICMWSKFPLST